MIIIHTWDSCYPTTISWRGNIENDLLDNINKVKSLITSLLLPAYFQIDKQVINDLFVNTYDNHIDNIKSMFYGLKFFRYVN